MTNTKIQIPWLQGREIRVVVIGDAILDEYLVGTVNRISPEAPVPVHQVSRTVHSAGGAGNTARNVKLAGGHVQLLTVIGDDEPGRQLCELLNADGIDTSDVVVVKDRPTVRKTRLTSSNQQMARIDWETIEPVSDAVQDQLISKLKGMDFDAILVSDYGKGTLPIRLLTTVLEYAKEKGKPAIVDPKGRDYSKYIHATLISPNRNEACLALGLDPVLDWSGEDLGRKLQKTFGLQNVLVTMGPKGMVLVPANEGGGPIELPAIAREVYDVSGAGDTVVSIMTLAFGANATFEQAVKLAQTAAAVVVEKWGTQPVTLEELERALEKNPDPRRASFSTSDKIIHRDTLAQVIKDPKSRNRRVVFTNGCFDLLHAGHISYLEEARSLGDLLVIGVNSDASVGRLKGSERPIVPLQNRMRLLAALGCVDYVVSFEEDTPQVLIETLLPDVLVKGADWAKKEIVGAEAVTKAGGVVDTIEFVAGLSTTQIVEKIKHLP
jgi:D-beta-D-heptose 7-phosphate kinase/D-beta-D-heptose 1-phosphate adenosyltransferase